MVFILGQIRQTIFAERWNIKLQHVLPISKQTPNPSAYTLLRCCVLLKNQNLVSREMS